MLLMPIWTLSKLQAGFFKRAKALVSVCSLCAHGQVVKDCWISQAELSRKLRLISCLYTVGGNTSGPR